MFDVKCLKCGKLYKDTEPDDYFCEECLTVKQKIAAKVDKQFANRPQGNIETPLQQYDRMKGDKKFISFNDFNNLNI